MPRKVNRVTGKEIGNRLHLACKARNVSMSIVALECGMTHSGLSNYKHKGTFPNCETLINICNFLGTSANYLLGITLEDEGSNAVPLNLRRDVTLKKGKRIK